VSKDLYEVLCKYAKDRGMTISATVRHLAVTAALEQKLNSYQVLECGKLITKILKTVENIANLRFADEDAQEESVELSVLKDIIMKARTFTDDPLWEKLI